MLARAVWSQQRGQDAHDRGLAGPVRPEQGQDLAPVGRYVDAGQRLSGAKFLRQALGLDYSGHQQPPSVVVARCNQAAGYR
jgi:hypothetical protein